MTDLSLECSACGKKFRVSFAVRPKQVSCPQCKARVSTAGEAAPNGVPPTAPASAAPPATTAAPPATTAAPPATTAPAAAAASPATAAVPPPGSAAPAPVPVPAPVTAPDASPAPAPAASEATPAVPAAKPEAQVPAKKGAAVAGKLRSSPADAKAQPPRPRRLPTLLKPEDVEFKGWTYDHEAERARGGLQKADVMGIVWIGAVLLMIGLILSRKLAPMAGKGMMALGGLGLLVAGYLFMKLKGKPDESRCARCKGSLGLVHTVPAARDCKANNYTRGTSGHAYRLESSPAKKVWEIHKKWHVCKACKRYFIAEKESLDFGGAVKADMEKREALYAEAAASPSAAAAAPAASPAAASVPAAPPAAVSAPPVAAPAQPAAAPANPPPAV